MNKKQAEMNGATMKELLMLVSNNIKTDLLRIESKLDMHIQIYDREKQVYLDQLAKHDAIIKHVCDELPEKGYCSKVDMMHEELFPQNGLSLSKRVDTLMYDRAMLKYVLVTSVGAILMSAASVLLKILWR